MYKTASDKSLWHYETFLMTFSEYSRRMDDKVYGEVFELYPYKWYDIRRFYKTALYRVQSFLKRLLMKFSKRNVKSPAIKGIGTFIIKRIDIIIFGLIIAYLVFKFGWN